MTCSELPEMNSAQIARKCLKSNALGDDTATVTVATLVQGLVAAFAVLLYIEARSHVRTSRRVPPPSAEVLEYERRQAVESSPVFRPDLIIRWDDEMALPQAPACSRDAVSEIRTARHRRTRVTRAETSR